MALAYGDVDGLMMLASRRGLDVLSEFLYVLWWNRPGSVPYTRPWVEFNVMFEIDFSDIKLCLAEGIYIA